MAFVNSTSNTGSSSLPIGTVPAGTATDQIALMLVTADSSSARFDSAKWPAGFTVLDSGFRTTPDGQAWGLGWKRLTAADSGSYSFSNDGGNGAWIVHVLLFGGRDTGNPPVASALNSGSSGVSPETVPANGVTALSGDDLIWLNFPDVNVSGAGNLHGFPSGYTQAQDSENGFSNLGSAYQENVAAGATGTVNGTFNFTSGTGGWAAYLVRIPSAGGAATVSDAPRYRRAHSGLYIPMR